MKQSPLGSVCLALLAALLLSLPQVAPKATNHSAIKRLNSTIEPTFFSIKDGKTSARRIQHLATTTTSSTTTSTSTTTTTTTTSTPAPMVSTLVESELGSSPNNLLTADTLPADGLGEPFGASMLANRLANEMDQPEQVHLSVSSDSPSTSSGLFNSLAADQANSTTENALLSDQDQRQSTGAPISPSSLSMSLDGMILNSGPRAAPQSESDLSRPRSTGKLAARMGDQPTKSTRQRTTNMDEGVQLPQQQQAGDFQAPRREMFDTQNGQQMFAGINSQSKPDDQMVMSVMSSADGKERRLVMISRDSLQSLQQLAAKQQQQQMLLTANQKMFNQQSNEKSTKQTLSRWQQGSMESEVPTTSSPAPTSLLAAEEPSSPASLAPPSTTVATTSSLAPNSTSGIEAQTQTTSSAQSVPIEQAQVTDGSSSPAAATTTTTTVGTFREVPVTEAAARKSPSAKRSKQGKGATKSGSGNSSRTKSSSSTNKEKSKSTKQTQSNLKWTNSGNRSTNKSKSGQKQQSNKPQQQQHQHQQANKQQVATSNSQSFFLDTGSLQSRAPALAGSLAVGAAQVVPPAQSEADQLDQLRAAIPGEPMVDYPIFAAPPKTSFDCMAQSCPGGYYADLESQCQVFHICQNDGRFDTFLCPNGTIFSQQHFVCVWWWQVDCQQSPAFYKLNDNIYCNSANIPPMSQVVAGSSRLLNTNSPTSTTARPMLAVVTANQQMDSSTGKPSSSSSLASVIGGNSLTPSANTNAQSEVVSQSSSTTSLADSTNSATSVLGGAAGSLTGAESGLPIRLQDQSMANGQANDMSSDLDSADFSIDQQQQQQQQEQLELLSRKA